MMAILPYLITGPSTVGILKNSAGGKRRSKPVKPHMKPITVSCIKEIFAKYIVRAKRKHPNQFKNNYTPHSMRHTTATHMLEAGVPHMVVKNFLEHVSLQTTQIDTEISQGSMDRHLKSWSDK